MHGTHRLRSPRSEESDPRRRPALPPPASHAATLRPAGRACAPTGVPGDPPCAEVLARAGALGVPASAPSRRDSSFRSSAPAAPGARCSRAARAVPSLDFAGRSHSGMEHTIAHASANPLRSSAVRVRRVRHGCVLMNMCAQGDLRERTQRRGGLAALKVGIALRARARCSPLLLWRLRCAARSGPNCNRRCAHRRRQTLPLRCCKCRPARPHEKRERMRARDHPHPRSRLLVPPRRRSRPAAARPSLRISGFAKPLRKATRLLSQPSARWLPVQNCVPRGDFRTVHPGQLRSL